MDEILYNIRKEMLTNMFNDENYRPMKLKELCVLLNVPKDEREDLKLILDRMVSEGLITIGSRGCYEKPAPDGACGDIFGNRREDLALCVSMAGKTIFLFRRNIQKMLFMKMRLR